MEMYITKLLNIIILYLKMLNLQNLHIYMYIYIYIYIYIYRLFRKNIISICPSSLLII